MVGREAGGWAGSSFSRPNFSQFQSLKIRRSMFLSYIKFDNRRIFSAQNCKKVRSGSLSVGFHQPDIHGTLVGNFLPDGEFHNFRASRSDDWWILCNLKTSIHRFWVSKIGKYLVRYLRGVFLPILLIVEGLAAAAAAVIYFRDRKSPGLLWHNFLSPKLGEISFIFLIIAMERLDGAVTT